MYNTITSRLENSTSLFEWIAVAICSKANFIYFSIQDSPREGSVCYKVIFNGHFKFKSSKFKIWTLFSRFYFHYFVVINLNCSLQVHPVDNVSTENGLKSGACCWRFSTRVNLCHNKSKLMINFHAKLINTVRYSKIHRLILPTCKVP